MWLAMEGMSLLNVDWLRLLGMSPLCADWPQVYYRVGMFAKQSLTRTLSPLPTNSQYLQNIRVASLETSTMTAQMAAQDADKASPWHVAYPTSKTAASSISKEEFLQLLKSGAVPGKDILLVDLRRNDHEVRGVGNPLIDFG